MYAEQRVDLKRLGANTARSARSTAGVSRSVYAEMVT